MTEPVRWHYELTDGELAHLARRVEWALQHQNQRFARAIPSARIPDRTRQVLVLVVALVGLGAVIALHALGGISGTLFTASIAFYGAALALGAVFPWYRARARRFAGRMIERRAARLLKPLGRLAPMTFEYALHDGRITTTSTRSSWLPPLEPRSIRLVIAVGPSLILFRRARGLNPCRMLHVPDEPARAAVLAAFPHAEHVELTGPLAGYGDAIPKATIASA
jgi:hypothetical protein